MFMYLHLFILLSVYISSLYDSYILGDNRKLAASLGLVKEMRLSVDSALGGASADAGSHTEVKPGEPDHEAGPPAMLHRKQAGVRDQSVICKLSEEIKGTTPPQPISCRAASCRPHPRPPAPFYPWSRAPPCGPGSMLHPGFPISLQQRVLAHVGITVKILVVMIVHIHNTNSILFIFRTK